MEIDGAILGEKLTAANQHLPHKGSAFLTVENIGIRFSRGFVLEFKGCARAERGVEIDQFDLSTVLFYKSIGYILRMSIDKLTITAKRVKFAAALR